MRRASAERQRKNLLNRRVAAVPECNNGSEGAGCLTFQQLRLNALAGFSGDEGRKSDGGAQGEIRGMGVAHTREGAE